MTEKHIALAAAPAPSPTAPTVSLGTLTAASPRQLIAAATEMASALADVIKSQRMAVTLQGRSFVRVEGWTTLAIMLGVVAREVSSTETDGVYVSVVELVRLSDQVVISRASAECGAPDEKDRQGRPLWANRPAFARRSMAQTRATGKACRLAFSWVMTLAGYEPTPAEEMLVAHDENPPEGARRERQPIVERVDEPIGDGPKAAEIEARISDLGLDRERVKLFCRSQFHAEHFGALTETQFDTLLRWLPRMASKAAREALVEVIRSADSPESLNRILSSRSAHPTITDIDWDTHVAKAIDVRWSELDSAPAVKGPPGE